MAIVYVLRCTTLAEMRERLLLMTVQQALGLASACVAALVVFLVGADVNHDIPDVAMLALGAVNVVLGAASAFFGQVNNMGKTLTAKYNRDMPLGYVADGVKPK